MFFCDYLNVTQQFSAGVYPDFLGGRMVSIDGACGLSQKEVIDKTTGEITQAWAITTSDDRCRHIFRITKGGSCP